MRLMQNNATVIDHFVYEEHNTILTEIWPANMLGSELFAINHEVTDRLHSYRENASFEGRFT